MADISAIFFILLIIGISFPAMLIAWWLLFPNLIARAQIRVEKSLASSFWLGFMITLMLAVSIFVLLALPFGPIKSLGWILLVASLAFSSIGSAGIAAHFGARLAQHNTLLPLNGFIRGAVILELAAFFPIIGWLFVWIPLLVTAIGATAFALLNWMPRESVVQVSERVPSQA